MTYGAVFEDREQGLLFSDITAPLKKKTPFGSVHKKIIVIAGPTAVGKSRLSLTIAKAIGGEIISADSMQVYRGMDVGTAKVKPEELGVIRHHLVDSREIQEEYNVVQFYHEAHQAIKEVFARGHVPIVVGGTGFYIHALLYGPPNGPPSMEGIRTSLEQELEEHGAEMLYERLRRFDPDYAVTITQRDKHKIIRALEIIALTNQKVSSFSKETPHEVEDYDFRCWFVYFPKEILYKRIEERCDQMIQEGLIDEVRQLEKEGLRENRSASQAIGYRQALEFLESAQTEKDWVQFVSAFKQASRRYAKRQFTWFRQKTRFRSLNMNEISEELVVETILQDYEIG
ncbi:MAG: tRNA (adenosine(37)-N6)-dimethylallyltransferase MiaA [Chlamydiota bacterium]